MARSNWDSTSLMIIGCAAGLWLLMTLQAILVPLFLAFIITIVSGTLLDTLTQRVEWEEIRAASEIGETATANPQHLFCRDFCRGLSRGCLGKSAAALNVKREESRLRRARTSTDSLGASADLAMSASVDVGDVGGVGDDAPIASAADVDVDGFCLSSEFALEVGENGPHFPIINFCKRHLDVLNSNDPIASVSEHNKHDVGPGTIIKKIALCWEPAVKGEHGARPGVCFCRSPKRLRAFQVRPVFLPL